ncbi:GAF domain-containing protein [Nakamurella sp. YIM 132087]|uniref:GAF domain-containing protein n=1 Tax=Nakamurella alba TaxID=2665158 RepID=A0A7K1FEK0_9ACTN|nr:LuxR C-terminal-related transcriptional regulator [Nakamurella alba]MTD12521.1 GAF domain-containing protein [Nakamurella alba]
MDELLPRVRRAVEHAAQLTARPDIVDDRRLASPATAGDVVHAAQQAVIDLLRRPPDPVVGMEAGAALVSLSDVRASLRELESERRATSVTQVHESLRRLRAIDSIDRLIAQTPLEIRRLGYNRSLLSRLSGRSWTPRSSFADHDPELQAALLRVGQAIPGRLGREIPETEVVRSRTALLVKDARHNPNVHHHLIDLAGTEVYIVAPLVVSGEVVGILHADQHVVSDRVTEFDREVLELFSEGLGCILERAMVGERLARFRRKLDEQSRSLDEITSGGFDLDPLPEDAGGHPGPVYAAGGPLADLTRREMEVLRLLAEGRTSAQLAEALYVAPGTVKTHVKNVLHKLGVNSRGEAVARYHAFRQSGTDG